MRLDPQKECLKCDQCGGIHFPEANADGVRSLGGDGKLACPVCKVPLTGAAAGGQELLHCERCRGLLVPVETFMAIVRELRARREGPPETPRPPHPRDRERSISCPKCGRRMDNHRYAGPGNIFIDNCPECGLNWLDHGELRRVFSAPDGQLAPDSWTPLVEDSAVEGNAASEEPDPAADPLDLLRRFLGWS